MHSESVTVCETWANISLVPRLLPCRKMGTRLSKYYMPCLLWEKQNIIMLTSKNCELIINQKTCLIVQKAQWWILQSRVWLLTTPAMIPIVINTTTITSIITTQRIHLKAWELRRGGHVYCSWMSNGEKVLFPLHASCTALGDWAYMKMQYIYFSVYG